MAELLSVDEISTSLDALNADWTGTPSSLKRSIEFASFPTAVEFINALAPICEELDHHPDLALRWRWVDVELSTHSAGGVTKKDVDLARRVDEVAATFPRSSS